MIYITPLATSAADAATAATLNAVKAKIGMIPNLYATLAKAPAALASLLQVNDAVGAGQLSGKEREVVALATAQANVVANTLTNYTNSVARTDIDFPVVALQLAA